MTYEHSDNYLIHYGVKGQKHGIRRFQNEDGSLTAEGREHYGVGEKRAGSGGSTSGVKRSKAEFKGLFKKNTGDSNKKNSADNNGPSDKGKGKGSRAAKFLKGAAIAASVAVVAGYAIKNRGAIKDAVSSIHNSAKISLNKMSSAHNSAKQVFYENWANNAKKSGDYDTYTRALSKAGRAEAKVDWAVHRQSSAAAERDRVRERQAQRKQHSQDMRDIKAVNRAKSKAAKRDSGSSSSRVASANDRARRNLDEINRRSREQAARVRRVDDQLERMNRKYGLR